MRKQILLMIAMIGICTGLGLLLIANGTALRESSDALESLIEEYRQEAVMLGIRAKSDELIWHANAWNTMQTDGWELKEFLLFMYPEVHGKEMSLEDIYFVMYNGEVIATTGNGIKIPGCLQGNVLYDNFHYDGTYYWNQIFLADGTNIGRIMYALDTSAYYPDSIQELYARTNAQVWDIHRIARTVFRIVTLAMGLVFLGTLILIYYWKNLTYLVLRETITHEDDKQKG